MPVPYHERDNYSYPTSCGCPDHPRYLVNQQASGAIAYGAEEGAVDGGHADFFMEFFAHTRQRLSIFPVFFLRQK